MTRNNIVLIGMMGSGKSTIGKLLASGLGFEFIDTDSIIEEREGKIIPEIFARSGEEYFRQVETSVLKEVLEKEKCVISCGGGVVETLKNIDFLQSAEKVFYLDADSRVLYDRIPIDGSRPKVSTYKNFEKLYEARRPKYLGCSKYTIHADRNPIEVVQEIMRQL